jgi:hypothetical protein
MKHNPEIPSEEFLSEGLVHVIPALRALKVFIDQVADRIRLGLDSWAPRLKHLGLFDLHNSQPYFYPEIPKNHPEQSISVGVMNTQSVAFYLRFDYAEIPSRRLYVGFWIYHPDKSARVDMYAALKKAESGDYVAEMEEGTIYFGTYVTLEGHFPNFAALLDGIAERVIPAFEAADFKRRFGSAFLLRKGKGDSS